MKIYETKILLSEIVENHDKFIKNNFLLFRNYKESILLINKLNIYDEINKLKIFISDKDFEKLILFLSEHNIYKNNPLCKLIIKNNKNYILPYEIYYINLTENLSIKELYKLFQVSYNSI